jgi:hypothetical protein
VSRHVLFALKVAAAMVGISLLLLLARSQGLVDGEWVLRGHNMVIGLGLAALYNIMPKMQYGPPPHSIRTAMLAQAVGRVSSWAMVLACLAWVALWALAPLGGARIGSMAALGIGVAVMLGYTVLKCIACRASKA